MQTKKSILFCPLDWGIGHASRSIPVIRYLNDNGHRVMIAADGKPLKLLQANFPKNDFITFPGYVPTYSEKNTLILKMIAESPKIFRSIYTEQSFVENQVRKFQIDGVISDNRFGSYSMKVPSVFISHQLNIQTPGFLNFTKPLIKYLNFNYINKFSEVWIPDFEHEPSLSGDLSHGSKTNIQMHYIGPLSRFEQRNTVEEKEIDLLVILSGPEPQRSIFENKIIKLLAQKTIKTIIIRGLPGEESLPNCPSHIQIMNHLAQDELQTIIEKSKTIVARAGYSTIMDLFILKQNAILIPTPGQTEQEYLAKHLNKNKWFVFISQKDFEIDMLENIQFEGFKNRQIVSNGFEDRLQTWVSQI